jgi:hypothetical protein
MSRYLVKHKGNFTYNESFNVYTINLRQLKMNITLA